MPSTPGTPQDFSQLRGVSHLLKCQAKKEAEGGAEKERDAQLLDDNYLDPTEWTFDLLVFGPCENRGIPHYLKTNPELATSKQDTHSADPFCFW